MADNGSSPIEGPAIRTVPIRRLVSRYMREATGFWSGATRWRAWGLTMTVLVLVTANIALMYALNRWNAFFFDALEQKRLDIVGRAVLWFAAIAVAMVVVAVAMVHARMRLQVRWREWLTTHSVDRWLENRKFYRLSIVDAAIDGPEYRIADDGRLATEPVVDFFVGLLNAVLAFGTFVGVLWVVGGSARLPIGDGVEIPGYLVFLAIFYSGVISIGTILVGNPLIRAVERKNQIEATMRFELGRLRESAESVALMGGEDEERAGVGQTVSELVRRWVTVVGCQAQITMITFSNFVVAPVLPLLVAAPNYLSGAMSLGQLMQCATAFVQVQVALNWLVENYIRLAEWIASVQRVTGLWQALDDLDDKLDPLQRPQIALVEGSDDHLRLEKLEVAQIDGTVVVDGAEAVIRQGEKVLLVGESGSGKSTLIRAIAGLWPWGSGTVRLPQGARVAFLPQRPYIPLATLRAALCYPEEVTPELDERVPQALARVGLGHLAPRLDEEARWDQILSGGEQQRLAFARLLITRPSLVIMDEATAALDEASQNSILETFHDELRETTVLSVGHRPGLEAKHDRKIVLLKYPRGARLGEAVPTMPQVKPRRLAGVLRRTLRPRPSPDLTSAAPPPD
jgi:putative ATP-binding cassette transporter